MLNHLIRLINEIFIKSNDGYSRSPISLLGNKLDLDLDSNGKQRINCTHLNKTEIELLFCAFCRSLNSMDLINLCSKFCSFRNDVPRCEADEHAKVNDMMFHEVSAAQSIGIHGSIRDVVLKLFSEEAKMIVMRTKKIATTTTKNPNALGLSKIRSQVLLKVPNFDGP